MGGLFEGASIQIGHNRYINIVRKQTLYKIALSLFLGLGLKFMGVPMMETIIWVLTSLAIYVFISNLTRKINFLDVTSLAACISYLLMPLLVYNVFGEHNKLAALWHTYMTVERKDYFLLALPATITLILGLWTPPLINARISDGELITRVRLYLSKRRIVGVLLFLTGIFSIPFVTLAPPSVQAIFYFGTQLTYVGAIYLLYSGNHLKLATIVMILALMIAQAVITGMYGELVYWSVMGVILMLIGKTGFTFTYKVLILCLGIVMLFLIQSIKHEYRAAVWKGAKRGNDPAVFFNLLADRIKHPEAIFGAERIYKVVVRANQGYLIGRAVEYVPKHEPFANGETIIKSLWSAVVPRFLWNDKPRAGGQENICRFLGDCGHYNYSYNIGQLGEAYVNFGVVGAWIYMFLYGYLLTNLFGIVRYFSVRIPSLILWTPILFYTAMIVETDLLTFINSFVKGVMFCAFCYFSFKLVLNVRL